MLTTELSCTPAIGWFKFEDVDSVCHRCGALLSTDVAYCPQCGAPQIRVPEDLPVSPASQASSSAVEDSLSGSSSGTALNWRQALPAASGAGFAMAIASMLPIVYALFPVWMLAGGWLAVLLYRRRSPLLLMSSAIGGKIGALAGLLGFIFFGVLTSSFLAIEIVVLHHGDEIRAEFLSLLQQSIGNNQDAQAQLLLHSAQTPEGLTMLLLAGMFLFLIAFLLLSTAGGMFAASYGRRKFR